MLLPYLIYNKEIKACFFILGWYLLFLYLPALVCGLQFNQELLMDWAQAINPMNKEHQIDTDETTLNGLTSLIPTLLMEKVPDPHALVYRRNIVNLDVRTVMHFISLIRILLLACVLYFLGRKPFSPPKTRLHQIWELSYLFILIPLLFPHQQHYAFFMMFPATLYVFYYLFRRQQRGLKSPVFVLILLSLVYLLTNAHLLLGEFRSYYDHYKIISYGGLIMIGLLAFLKPDKISKEN